MSNVRPFMRCGLVVATVILCTEHASAARVRYHYVPADAQGAMTLLPLSANVPGERVSAFGRSPYCQAPRPTCNIPLRHPTTGCVLRVPLALPPDVPTIEHRASRVTYNYGSFAVEVLFLADGSVDVTYNNGLLREPWTGQ